MVNTYLFFDGCFSKKQPFFFLVVLLFLFFSNCSKKAEIDQSDEILFSVNDVDITVFDFETKYVKHLIETGRNDTKNERYAYMNQMIDNLVLAKKASETGYLDNSIYQSAINFQQRKSMVDYYFVDEMNKIIEEPTDDEVRLAYAKKQRRVYVRHLFSVLESELIEPFQRLQNGESFVDVANDFYETQQYDSTAGYLGPISYFGVDDAFAEAAYGTNEGEFSAPIRSMFGYHIVYVEYIEFPAMLTEDDYQYRRQGISSQVKLRNQRLVANDYIRELMGSLVVEVDRENVLELREVILNLSGEEILNQTQQQEQENDNWNDQRLDALEASFDKDKVLATYVMSGERVDFTFDDYLKWLPYLSFNESKNRTAASIGRGMRNEVLFSLASEDNYTNDDRVQNQVSQRGYDILSELYQYDLTTQALLDTNSIEVPNSFKERLVRNRTVQLVASYWTIGAGDLQEAERIKADIEGGGVAMSYDTFQEDLERAIDPTDPNYTLIRDGLIETPVLAFSQEDGWMVLNVLKREITEINDQTNTSLLETRYKVFNTLNEEIVGLREGAEITVDTLLFNDIYDLNKKE